MADRYVIASFSLLICRDELIKKLGCNLDLSVTSDEELILRCYLKWGNEMVHQLHGDWAFAVWDNVKQSLFLARNQHADGTLFYYQAGSKFFFSSLLTGLVNIEGIPNKLDKEKFFIESLVISGYRSKTLYENIHFLRPGHQLTVSKNEVQLSQYWFPLEIPKVNFKHDQEYFEAFYETYNRAIQDRLSLSDQWGFALSGGLDSAATVGLASKYFKEKNEELRALCYVPSNNDFKKLNSKREYGDESEFAQVTADFNKNVNLEYVTKDDLFWEGMIDYKRDFGVPPNIHNVWFADAIAEGAKGRGMDMVMMAQGGNQGLSFKGVPSHVSLSQYQSDLRNGLNLNTLEFIKYSLKSTYSSGKKRVKNSPKIKKKKILNTLNNLTFLSQEFINDVNGYDLLEAHYYGVDKCLTEGEFKFRRQLKPGSHCRLGLWNQIATRYDIAYVDPTRDVRLLELVSSFPNHIFYRKEEPKFLYKQSFKEVVSPKVMYNRRSGMSLSDIPHQLKNDLARFNTLIEDKQNDAVFQEMVDGKKIKALYKTIEEETSFSEVFIDELRKKSSSLFQALLT